MSSPDVVVLGLGNLLMQDEGVGIHALRLLQETTSFEPEIELVDGGTTGLELLDFFEEGRKVLMIDAMTFDAEPGTIGKVVGDDILAKLNTKMSLHHLGLSDVLGLVKLLDREPSELVLIGVQPGSMELEMGLSETLQAVLPKVVEHCRDQLQRWGVTTHHN